MDLILQKRGLCWEKPWGSLPFSWWDCFAVLMPLVKCYLRFPVRADGDAGSDKAFSLQGGDRLSPAGAWAVVLPAVWWKKGLFT